MITNIFFEICQRHIYSFVYFEITGGNLIKWNVFVVSISLGNTVTNSGRPKLLSGESICGIYSIWKCCTPLHQLKEAHKSEQ